MYLGWALIAEGASDEDYLGSLVPRLLEDIIFRDGVMPVDVPATFIGLGRKGRDVKSVAEEGCQAADAFHLLFVHADTGGRALEAGLGARSQAYIDAMHELCDQRKDRAIVIAPWSAPRFTGHSASLI